MARAAAEIDPVRAISSRSRALPGPIEAPGAISTLMESAGMIGTLYTAGYDGKREVSPLRFVIVLLAAALALALPAASAAASAGKRPVIFAAASLKGPLDAVAAAFRAETGIQVVISYAGSNALARQIEQGAPAQLFISSDGAWMDYLGERALLAPESRRDLLANALVLVAPAASATRLTIAPGFDLGGALGTGRLAMADPQAAPAGKYARQALESLGAWEGVAGRLAPTGNVRAALALVALGEAPLGIVYATDAIAEPKVISLGAFPAESHDPILYVAALTVTAGPEAAAFLGFLRGAAAQAIFAGAGFARPAG